MTSWLRYLITFVVGCHGFTYIPFGIFVHGTLKEWVASFRRALPIWALPPARSASSVRRSSPSLASHTPSTVCWSWFGFS
jgi:hypothetical protein